MYKNSLDYYKILKALEAASKHLQNHCSEQGMEALKEAEMNLYE